MSRRQAQNKRGGGRVTESRRRSGGCSTNTNKTNEKRIRSSCQKEGHEEARDLKFHLAAVTNASKWYRQCDEYDLIVSEEVILRTSLLQSVKNSHLDFLMVFGFSVQTKLL